MVTQRNDIDARTLRDMLGRGERVTVVDVRKQEAHSEGSIPGSVNFDAYDAPCTLATSVPWRNSSCRRARGW